MGFSQLGVRVLWRTADAQPRGSAEVWHRPVDADTVPCRSTSECTPAEVEQSTASLSAPPLAFQTRWPWLPSSTSRRCRRCSSTRSRTTWIAAVFDARRQHRTTSESRQALRPGRTSFHPAARRRATAASWPVWNSSSGGRRPLLQLRRRWCLMCRGGRWRR